LDTTTTTTTTAAPKKVRRKVSKPFKCQECGRKLSLTQAEKAMSVGCPGCGGSDVDLA
jgi:DNA-directed RNA polymerase subunit RPC12/RpoP